jgi:hypothetical protein
LILTCARMHRIALAMLCLFSSAAASFASIWQSSDWALTSTDEAGLGYDSNLFARHDGDGDGYAEIFPSLLLKRLKSYTDMEITFAVKSTNYFTRTDLNSFDPSLDLEIRYPYDEFVFPTQQFDVRASRSTIVDGDIGGRLRAQDLSTRWEGNIAASEKTILQGRAEVHQTDYLTQGYSDNEFATAGLTLAYVENQNLELGAGYDYKYAVSRPSDSSLSRTYLSQNLVSIRGRGDFLPKVSGFVTVGVADSAYTGEVSQSYVDVEGEIGIVWVVTERGKFTLKANRESYFSPSGSEYITTNFGPEWTEELATEYFATVGADFQQTLNRFAVGSRTDHAYGGHLELTHSITDRYAAALTIRYITQDSPQLVYNYDRATVYASFVAKF